MNNHQQDEQQQVNQQEKFKMLQDLLKQIGFTDNVPLTLNYCSLPPDDKKNCLEDIKAITEHMFNIAPGQVSALCRLLKETVDWNIDD
ncbi:unnamed protein product [Rotaria magnacalcarata]|uniref:Uncharacterized protein n=1 Tax=Rotaria magnacalcarata TaxID=392030 RepID=A0A815ZQ29_9BILA|nr:unnamed protein product [Rotaria magnacalcarata]CAF2094966.1 unnamed protein product [Rotaria magnacalcarata]CAF3791025.1 unnamed protein product [Rotaria magnacalcarata]CAF4320907.1 unnamed protein product [Rotaria magnacalcarata]CAF4506748.1 unnamed protein product [Rotaria magnacalcarata]